MNYGKPIKTRAVLFVLASAPAPAAEPVRKPVSKTDAPALSNTMARGRMYSVAVAKKL